MSDQAGLEGDLLGDGDGLYDDTYVSNSDAQAFDERPVEDNPPEPEPSQSEIITDYVVQEHHTEEQPEAAEEQPQAVESASADQFASSAPAEEKSSSEGKMFIGGLSWDTTVEKLREHFSKYGEIVDAVVMKDPHTGRSRGFGFVTFADAAVCDRVLNEGPHMIDGRQVDPKKAVPEGESRPRGGPRGETKTKKIFVGGLPAEATEDSLRQLFQSHGTIEDVALMRDKETNRLRGFGFVTFESEDAVDSVCREAFYELMGKKVEVKKAEPLGSRRDGPRDNYGGGYGSRDSGRGGRGGGRGGYGGGYGGRDYGGERGSGYGGRGGYGGGYGGGRDSYGRGGYGGWGSGGYDRSGYGDYSGYGSGYGARGASGYGYDQSYYDQRGAAQGSSAYGNAWAGYQGYGSGYGGYDYSGMGTYNQSSSSYGPSSNGAGYQRAQRSYKPY